MWKLDSQNTANGWQSITANGGSSPDARFASICWVSSEGRLILFGGNALANGQNNQRNDVWSFNPGTLVWTSTPLALADSITSIAPVDSSGRWLDSNYTLWIFSGRTGSNLQYSNDLWALGTPHPHLPSPVHFLITFSSSSDVDECSSGTAVCSPKAICSNIIGSYNCNCLPGYSGDGKTCNGMYHWRGWVVERN